MTYPHELKWTARLDRRLVGRKGGKHHVLVDITAPARPQDETPDRPPLNLALVIDASGSMSGGPLEAACEAARGVIDALAPTDRLTLVSFADDVIVHCDAAPLDAEGRVAARHAVDGLHTRGCTNLGAGWLEGCERVALAMERAAAADAERAWQNRVILLSDGHANRGLTDPEELGYRAAGLRQRGLYTSTVGIGDNYSPVQLEVLAEQGGGRLHDAPLGEDIIAVVLGELGEILEAAADDITLTVHHPRTMSVGAFGRLPVNEGDGVTTVSVGGLTAGATRQVVLQVAVPAGTLGDRFALSLDPSWRTPDGEPCTAQPLPVELVRVPESERAAELPDPAVLRRIAEMWHNHLVLQSTMLNTEGRHEEAERLIRESLDDFRRYCAGVPGTRALIERLQWHVREVADPMEMNVAKAHISSAKLFVCQAMDHRVNQRELGPRDPDSKEPEV